MGVWYYAYMFPGTGQALTPGNAVGPLLEAGLTFNDSISTAVIIDDLGHLENIERVKLSGSPADEIERRLRDEQQFQVQCQNRELFFVLFSAVRYTNPHMGLAWSHSMFRALGTDSQEKYWRLVRTVARACNATYVIVIIESPGYFEDHFVAVDGRRVFEKRLPSGNEYEIYAVWIRADSPDELPIGIAERITSRHVGEGFEEHTVE